MATIGKHIITVTGADVGNVIAAYRISVKRIHCIGVVGTVAGNTFRIEDPSGNLLYRTQAGGAYYESESITQRIWPDGFKLITLDSGSIDVEFEPQGSTIY